MPLERKMENHKECIVKVDGESNSVTGVNACNTILNLFMMKIS